MNNFAPILIPTLCRYDHFKSCVESLSACTHADKTDLYIALDYPLNKTHWEGYTKIEKYVDQIEGFKSVTVVKRNENFGSLGNLRAARNEIFKKYDRLILSEDDNFFSPNFLDYINKGLGKFKDDPHVFAISGYNYPIEISKDYKYNIYKWKGFSAWGCGIWRDRIDKVDYSLNQVKVFLRKPKNILKLNKYADHYFPHLLKLIETNRTIDDTFFCLHLVKNDMVSIFPVVSKVRNYGHDGSGENCEVLQSNIYESQLIDTAKIFEFEHSIENLTENKQINKTLRKHFRINYLDKLRTFLGYISLKF